MVTIVAFFHPCAAASMHILARFGETAEIDKYLKCTEAEDVNSRDLFGTTSLVWAARNGHDDTVEYLLCTVNADVSAPGFGGWSALQHAVSCSRENMVAILLNHDANPNKADETGSCALHIAAARGAINIVTRLIESHADVNAMNAAGLRPLHYSAPFGHASCWTGEELGANFDVLDSIPEGMEDLVAEYREKLVETAVEQDEEILESYLETGEAPSIEDLKKCIRKGTISFSFVPVMNGTAFKNKGVQPLLDAVVDYLPSPLDLPPVAGKNPKDDEEKLTRPCDADAPFSGLAFKVAADPFIGTLTFFRIYSGSIEQGQMAWNPRTKSKERIGRFVLMHSNTREEIKKASTGDIIALVGMKNTTTGDTLCDPQNPIVLEKMDFPEPVIKVACEPETKQDADKMIDALTKLAAEDPSFRFSRDEEANQTMIEGMGELHLDIIVDRMKREFKVNAKVGRPQVAYRETITTSHKLWYTHKKQTGGSGQYAKIQIAFEPNPGEGFEFVNDIIGMAVPKEYIPGVIKGVEEGMGDGIIANYPVVDVKARLTDGATHPVDSSVMAFSTAGRFAFREAAAQCAPVVMEPLMKVEVTTPEEYLGNVIGDLNSRRGVVESLEDRFGLKVINAKVPLANMFQYIGSLRGLSKGRATFAMELGGYEPVPDNVAEELRK